MWIQRTDSDETMLSLATIAALFLACLPPEAVSQQCRSGVTDEIRQSVREQLRQGGGNGTIPTVAVNCGQVRLFAKCGSVLVCCTAKIELQSDVFICNVLSGSCTSMIYCLQLLIIHSMHCKFFIKYWFIL